MFDIYNIFHDLQNKSLNIYYNLIMLNKNCMLKKLLLCAVSILFVCGISSCETDEPDQPSNSSSSSSSKKEVKAEIAKVSSTTTTSDFTVTFRVKSVDFPVVSMKYSRESGKTSSPSLNKSSSPKCVDIVEMKQSGYSWYYYKTTHTGFSGGNYVYYKISASNSKGSDTASGYCIIRR